MAEENPVSPTNVTTHAVQATTEVLDSNGNNLQSSTTSALADIFGKMEEGVPANDAIEEVNKPTREERKEEKKAEKIEEQRVESEVSELEKKLNEKQESQNDFAEELSRDSGKKKVEKPKEEPKAEPKADDPESVSEEELAVLPHDKPKTAKRISALLQKIKEADGRVATTAKERDDKATKLAELEGKLATVKTSDPETEKKVQEQLEELSKYRRLYDLDNDPEVKTKYDSRIQSAEDSIPVILKRNAANDALLKVISEEGGWSKFSSSSKSFNVGDGQTLTAAEIAENVMRALPLGERNQIQAAMMEKIQVERDRQRFYDEQKSTASKYFKEKDEQRVKASKDQDEAIQKTAKEIEDWHKQVESESDFLKVKEVPKDATPEQKAEIEEDNKYNKQLKGLLNKSLTGQKPLKEMLDIVYDSVRYYDERRNIVKLTKQVSSLQKELNEAKLALDTYKKAGRSTSKQGSIAGTGGSSTQSLTQAQKRPPSLEDAFDRLERGQTVTGESEE